MRTLPCLGQALFDKDVVMGSGASHALPSEPFVVAVLTPQAVLTPSQCNKMRGTVAGRASRVAR